MRRQILSFLLPFIVWGHVFSDVGVKSYPLKGIDTIFVLIETLDEDAREAGVNVERLKTVVELRLRREGIVVAEELDGTIPYLYVNISVAGKAFHVSLDLNERVDLCRDASIRCRAKTWDTGTTGTPAKPDFVDACLSELLDEFLNDWYKANPKK